MEAIDLRKDRSYKAKREPEIIEVPEMQFVMVDGEGGPEPTGMEETDFQKAMRALFGIIYTIKFWDKKHDGPVGFAKFSLAPVEGLWWTTSGKMFNSKAPSDWKWTVMLRVPGFVTPDYFDEVVAECIAQKQSNTYKRARLESFAEGECVQIMHIGPYDQEQTDIDKMHAYAKEHGYVLSGKHHELYFGDPRRSAPEKLKTILRQPVCRVA